MRKRLAGTLRHIAFFIALLINPLLFVLAIFQTWHLGHVLAAWGVGSLVILAMVHLATGGDLPEIGDRRIG